MAVSEHALLKNHRTQARLQQTPAAYLHSLQRLGEEVTSYRPILTLFSDILSNFCCRAHYHHCTYQCTLSDYGFVFSVNIFRDAMLENAGHLYSLNVFSAGFVITATFFNLHTPNQASREGEGCEAYCFDPHALLRGTLQRERWCRRISRRENNPQNSLRHSQPLYQCKTDHYLRLTGLFTFHKPPYFVHPSTSPLFFLFIIIFYFILFYFIVVQVF